MIECICDCGTVKRIDMSNLTRKTNPQTSCGCLRLERVTKHGCAKKSLSDSGNGSREYVIWRGMKQRCENPNHEAFAHYGGRGIKVCDRWAHSFENFFSDMGVAPEKAIQEQSTVPSCVVMIFHHDNRETLERMYLGPYDDMRLSTSHLPDPMVVGRPDKSLFGIRGFEKYRTKVRLSQPTRKAAKRVLEFFTGQINNDLTKVLLA